MTTLWPRVLLAMLCCLLAVATSASAHHERCIVGEMRDVDPSAKKHHLGLGDVRTKP